MRKEHEDALGSRSHELSGSSVHDHLHFSSTDQSPPMVFSGSIMDRSFVVSSYIVMSRKTIKARRGELSKRRCYLAAAHATLRDCRHGM